MRVSLERPGQEAGVLEVGGGFYAEGPTVSGLHALETPAEVAAELTLLGAMLRPNGSWTIPTPWGAGLVSVVRNSDGAPCVLSQTGVGGHVVYVAPDVDGAWQAAVEKVRASTSDKVLLEMCFGKPIG